MAKKTTETAYIIPGQIDGAQVRQALVEAGIGVERAEDRFAVARHETVVLYHGQRYVGVAGLGRLLASRNSQPNCHAPSSRVYHGPPSRMFEDSAPSPA